MKHQHAAARRPKQRAEGLLSACAALQFTVAQAVHGGTLPHAAPIAQQTVARRGQLNLGALNTHPAQAEQFTALGVQGRHLRVTDEKGQRAQRRADRGQSGGPQRAQTRIESAAPRTAPAPEAQSSHQPRPAR